MGRFLLWIFLLLAVAVAPVAADEVAVKDFSGGGTTTTGMFHVHDRWEVRWSARRVVSVAVMAANGTIVAGGSGVIRGSLFVPAGGDYYLRITDDSATAGTDDTPLDVEENNTSWHLQVVELPTAVASTNSLTVYTPYFTVPDSAITPTTPVIPLPPPKLSDAQLNAVVIVKGDNAQGAGFLVKMPQGMFVMTHLHLLADNPNVQLISPSGATLTVLGLKGSIDRDLALFAVKGDHLSPLPVAADGAPGVSVGDWMLIPTLGTDAEQTTPMATHVLGVSPVRIDFDQKIAASSEGAPVIQAATGNAVAIVTAEKKVNLTDTVAQAWALNPAPGSAKVIPNYGLPLAGTMWENYDPARFLSETQFLKQFHDTTRSLDSYLNGRKRGKAAAGDDGPPDNRTYLANSRLHDAQVSFMQLAGGADQGQQIDAANELLNDLQGIADTDVSTLSDAMGGFYSYDARWAREELAYRKEIKKQLDDMSDSPVELDSLARTR